MPILQGQTFVTRQVVGIPQLPICKAIIGGYKLHL